MPHRPGCGRFSRLKTPNARVVEWQTRTFEGRMPKGMRVQVPPRAPNFSACANKPFTARMTRSLSCLLRRRRSLLLIARRTYVREKVFTSHWERIAKSAPPCSHLIATTKVRPYFFLSKAIFCSSPWLKAETWIVISANGKIGNGATARPQAAVSPNFTTAS